MNGKEFYQTSLKMVDNQGDSVYWFIATRGNFLIALFADGISEDKTRQVFDSFIIKTMDKQSLSIKSQIFLPLISTNSSASEVTSAEMQWRGPAGRVAWAFNDNWGIAHYGAWFIGRNGRGQYFICAFPPSAYSSWDWWGNGRNVLLLNKRFLAINPSMWNPGCHYAITDYP